MAVAEKVREYLEKMPAPYQAHVLQYVEYLWGKLQDSPGDEDTQWQQFALASALIDMEERDEVTYTVGDLEERFI